MGCLGMCVLLARQGMRKGERKGEVYSENVVK